MPVSIRTKIGGSVVGISVGIGIGWLVFASSSRSVPVGPAGIESVPVQNKENSTAGPSSDQAVVGLRDDLRRVKQDLAALRASAGRKDRGAADGGKNTSAVRAVLDKLTPKERDDLRKSTAVATYDELLRSEPRDGQWATEQEARIRGIFGDVTTSAMIDVTCNSTVCRTKIAHNDESSRMDFIDEKIIGKAPFDTNCFFTRLTDEIGTVVYCSRSGRKLPRVDIYKL